MVEAVHIGFRVAGRFRLDEIVRAFTIGRAYLATDERSNRRVLAFEDAGTRGASVDQLVAWSGRCTAVLPVEMVVRERVSVAIFGVDRGTTLAERLRPRKADPNGLASLADSPHSETPPIAALQDGRAVAGRLFEALATLHEVGIVHGGVSPRNLWLSSDGRVRFLGLGLYLDEAAVAYAGHVQTWPFIAPDRLLPTGKPASVGPTFAGDVFAASLIAFACLAGVVPPRASRSPPVLDLGARRERPTGDVAASRDRGRTADLLVRARARRPRCVLRARAVGASWRTARERPGAARRVARARARRVAGERQRTSGRGEPERAPV
jgi:hypothetical protein